MRSILVLAVSLWCSASIPAFSAGQTMPRINEMPQSGSQQLTAGETLRLVCSHDQAVYWMLPNNTMYVDYSNPVDDNRLRLNTTTPVTPTRWEAVLEIANLNHADTGDYMCYALAANDPAGGARRKSIKNNVYVFVSDAVAGHTFLHWKKFTPYGHLIAISLPAVIDCKVTHADASVTLWVDRKEQTQLSVYYDPTKGFVLPAQAAGAGWSDGKSHQAKCRARSPDGSEDELRFLLLVVNSTRESDLPITVNATSAATAYIGGRLHLVCSIPGDSFLGRCDWDFPDKPNSPDPNRVKLETGTLNGRDTPYVSLSIYPLRSSDRGAYNCSCVYSNTRNSTALQLSPSATKGQYRVLSHSPVIVDGQAGHSAEFSIRAAIWPADFRVEWARRYISPIDGAHELTLRPTSRISIMTTQPSVDDSGFVTATYSLKIDGLRATDSADYLISIAMGGDNRLSRKFQLIVQTSSIIPRISTASQGNLSELVDRRFLERSVHYSLICHGIGLPRPTMRLAWKPCRNHVNCAWRQLTPSQQADGSFERIYVYRLHATETGTFSCAVSGSGDDGVLEELIVTDVPNAQLPSVRGLGIVAMHRPSAGDAPDGQPHEGDRLSLSCLAQKYDYSLVRWEWRGNGTSIWLGSRNFSRDGYTVEWDESSHFSNRLNLIFERLTAADSGEYECSAILGDNARSVQIRPYHLQVVRVVAPRIAFGTSKPKLSVKYGESITLRCAVEGTPTPRRAWRLNGREYNGKPGITFSPGAENLTITRAVGEDAGYYTCRATNRAGEAVANITLSVTGAPPKQFLGKAAILAICFCLLIATCVVLLLLCLLLAQKRREREKTALLTELYNQLMSTADSEGQAGLPKLDPNRPLNRQAENLPYDRRFELSKEQLRLEEVIGEGQFGKVWRGSLYLGGGAQGRASVRPVAVKVPQHGRSLRDQKALLDELKIMVHIGQHVNVLSLIGAVTKYMAKGELFVVMELCELGSLLDWLKRNRATYLDEIVPEDQLNLSRVRPNLSTDGYLLPNQMEDDFSETVYQAQCDPRWSQQLDDNRSKTGILSTSDLLSYSYQAANGMDYLAEKNLIHRDLAARNLLLTGEQRVKIADFGLARQNEIYHIDTSRNVPLPLKWLALESIVDQEFTVHSDVWSFGVVLWEIFSLAHTPFAEQEFGSGFVAHLKQGNRLEQPPFSPDEIFHLMRQCWLVTPTDRPSFADCRQLIGVQLERCSKQLYDHLTASLAQDYVNWSGNSDLGLDEDDHAQREAARALRYRNGFSALPQNDPEVDVDAVNNETYMMQAVENVVLPRSYRSVAV